MILSKEPKDVDISHGLIGSGFGVSEIEMVACNIVVISRRKGGWFPFSWEDYCNLCDHEVDGFSSGGARCGGRSEYASIEEMVSLKAIQEIDGLFYVTDKFIELCQSK